MRANDKISPLLFASTLLITLLMAMPAKAQQAAAQPASAASEPKPVEISVNDPAIRAATRKAQATLNRFLPIAAKEDPNNQAVSLKVAIREGSKVEHIWITPFKVQGKRFSGRINDKPEVLTKVKQGDEWTFARKDIVDWMYYDTAGGKMHGNYSTCAKLTKGPKEDIAEMKRMYGLDCGF
jgi:uncharacterized protein YegJ (DUF2314 family)